MTFDNKYKLMIATCMISIVLIAIIGVLCDLVFDRVLFKMRGCSSP